MKRSLTIILLCALAMSSCKKYEEAPLLDHPAYMRVFNNLSVGVDVLHSGQSSTFLTFVMDPQTGGDNVIDTGAVVCDFLTTRQLFSLSYPLNEGNSSTNTTYTDPASGFPIGSTTPLNFEYPGNAHVLTAPPLNGFDMSAWAQVPSGKHRMVFIRRPQSAVPFRALSTVIRQDVLLDTTVDFTPGQVYTLEVVSRNIDEGKYGLYVRREAFLNQSFEENKLYLGFVNLSGVQPKSSQYGLSTGYSDKIAIYYTYWLYDDIYDPTGIGDARYNALPGYNNNYYTTLQTKMDTTIPYLAIPLLPASNFFLQDTLRTYGPPYTFIGRGGTNIGTLPYVQLNLNDATSAGANFQINCAADPKKINNYVASGTQALVTEQLPNLNLIVNTGKAYHIYSTLNIMEIAYDRVYMMQIQRAFNEVPEN